MNPVPDGLSLDFLTNIPLKNATVESHSNGNRRKRKESFQKSPTPTYQKPGLFRSAEREKALDFLTSIPTSAYASSEEPSEVAPEEETHFPDVKIEKTGSYEDLLDVTAKMHVQQKYDGINMESPVISLNIGGGPPFTTISYVKYSIRKEGSSHKISKKPTGTIKVSNSSSDFGQSVSLRHLFIEKPESYDPYFIDNNPLMLDKHYKRMDLSSYKSTVIYYMKEAQLISLMNQQFLERNEDWIPDPKLTLSKIRKVKLIMLNLLFTGDMEISSLAMSYAIFEKLILLKLVSRENRKLCASACMVLAFKFNENEAEHREKAFVRNVEKYLGVEANDIFRIEFEVYCHLKFALHLPISELTPHLSKIRSYISLMGHFE